MGLERWERGNWAAALGAGLLLRGLFVWVHPRFVGDTLVYGDLAHNMLAHGVYGLTEDRIRPTLIRLPGYPLFLALCFLLFGTGNYLAVVWVQVFVDLLGCWLLGMLARRVFGARVGLVCVWMAALCPFTANYAAAALTETLSIFCVVLGFWGVVGWMCFGLARGAALGLRASSPRWSPSASLRRTEWAGVVGLAVCGAVLLRPDGILLAAVLLSAMGWVAWRGERPQTPYGNDNTESTAARGVAWWGVALAGGMLVGCLGLWTLRNWRVYHTVQPLAPKYANDPGEAAPLGFARWYRTWGVGLGDTARVYWMYDGGTLRLDDLPAWAFDTPAQRTETAGVYARYNADLSSTPGTEAAFARLAAEREKAHPVRAFVAMPLARLGDMWLRPRTELLPRMPLNWWRPSGSAEGEGPRYEVGPMVFAWGYGLLNAALLGCAVVGLWRWRRSFDLARGAPLSMTALHERGVLVAAMAGFTVLRCGLLLTIDNSEPRYVLECYPIVIFLAAAAALRAR